MRQFFGRLSNALARFLYGRNGTDQLGAAMLAAYLVLMVLRTLAVMLTHSHHAANLFDFLMLVLAAVILWRCLSKNLEKRRAENARFLAWWRPKRARLAAAKARRQDKEHRYFTCKSCGAVCRVPAGKGNIEITCPKCGGTLRVKS